MLQLSLRLGTKVCARCFVEKGVDQFYVRRGTDRVYSYCKPCSREMGRERVASGKKKPGVWTPERLARAREARALLRRGKSCLVCGSEVGRGKSLYCSQACQNKASAIREKGWTVGAYRDAVAGGVCQACGKPALGRMVVDHCHATVSGRGWIHQRCNVGVAQSRDDPEELFRWSTYLVRHTFDLRELCAA